MTTSAIINNSQPVTEGINQSAQSVIPTNQDLSQNNLLKINRDMYVGSVHKDNTYSSSIKNSVKIQTSTIMKSSAGAQIAEDIVKEIEKTVQRLNRYNLSKSNRLLKPVETIK